MKIISYSLWGNNPMYTVGAIKNIQLAQKYYPDWICRFYCDEHLEQKVIDKINSYPNAQIVFKRSQMKNNMFWRFEAFSDDDAEYIIVRDTDSRFTQREVNAVQQWVESGKLFHVMRDHPYHTGKISTPTLNIMGGMCGIKGGTITNIDYLITKYLYDYNPNSLFGHNEHFLTSIIYPIIKDSCIVHDEFFSNYPFQDKREGLEFIGEKFDENDNPIEEHRTALKNYLNEHKTR